MRTWDKYKYSEIKLCADAGRIQRQEEYRCDMNTDMGRIQIRDERRYGTHTDIGHIQMQLNKTLSKSWMLRVIQDPYAQFYRWLSFQMMRPETAWTCLQRLRSRQNLFWSAEQMFFS